LTPIEQIESLVARGRYLEARHSAKSLLKTSGELRLKQLYALALSKSAAPEAARDFLEPIYKSIEPDAETAGILGSIYKELFRKNQTSAFATLSRDTYLANYLATGSYYTGINAASMSAMLMQSAKSKEIARQIIDKLKDSAHTFWEVVTVAEAHLVLKERQAAVDTYATARKIAGSDWGYVMSVHRQLWLLSHYIPVSKELLTMFEPPRVAAFVGHMIDHPNRSVSRFAPSMEAAVAHAIRQDIERLKIQVGWCALACGGDILFAEAMAEAGGTVNVLLPFDVADFVEQSVSFAGEHWVERFQVLVRKFPVTFMTRENYAGDDALFSLQGKVILGSAVLQSKSFQSEPVLLTVLSQADLTIKEGGTRNVTNNWPYPATHVNVGLESLGLSATRVKASKETLEKKIPTNRPVRFLMRIDTSSLPLPDREKVLKAIELKASDDSSPCDRVADGQACWILAFDYETGVIDMLKVLGATKQGRQAAITLHAGPVHTKEIAMGSTIEQLKLIAGYSLPGLTLASHTFGALLALLPAQFQVDYASALPGPDGDETPVYKIAISQG
jgi:hypothetical protein